MYHVSRRSAAGLAVAVLAVLSLLTGCSPKKDEPAPAHEDAGQPHPNPGMLHSTKP